MLLERLRKQKQILDLSAKRIKSFLKPISLWSTELSGLSSN